MEMIETGRGRPIAKKLPGTGPILAAQALVAEMILEKERAVVIRGGTLVHSAQQQHLEVEGK